jgi:hypothetical protein
VIAVAVAHRPGGAARGEKLPPGGGVRIAADAIGAMQVRIA